MVQFSLMHSCFSYESVSALSVTIRLLQEWSVSLQKNLFMSSMAIGLHSQCHGSNDTTHRLSHRTAATTRFSTETDGAKFLPTIRSGRPGVTSQAFPRWRHQSDVVHFW